MPYQPKTNRREHSLETVAGIWALHCAGFSAFKISLQNGLPKSTITCIIRRLKKEGNHESKKTKRTGRPRKLGPRAERRLIRHMCQEPFSTLTDLATPSKSGHQLCRNTVRQYLAKNEYYAFRPRRKPHLTPRHKEERLKFARKMQFWRLPDVACICFSDESTFEIGLCRKSQYVRRRYGHAYESRYLEPTFKSGRSSVGIWVLFHWILNPN